MAPIKPDYLGVEGSILWDEITQYELRPDEVSLLKQICDEADLIERLRLELVDAPLQVKGSQGQMVSSPLVSELRQHRAILKSLLAALKLPDDDASSKPSATTAAVAMNAHRWGRTRGA